MSLKWVFPPTGGGVAQGFNDSAQEHFRNNAWKHAIRELVQNSLDAVHDKSRPVTIEISKIMVPRSEVGASDLTGHIKEALKRTKEQGEQAGEKFYVRALRILGKKTIDTLAVTDSNTTGLVGDKWDALVYKEGTTNKGGVGAAGGSFGVGKNAPYLVSDLKVVCYSTRYLLRGRQENFIARCKLVAHDDPKKRNGELQHIGFGTKAHVKPGTRANPTRGRDIYSDFRLGGAGSGVFIVGFNPLTKDWQTMAKRSIAENFFAAVHEKKLRIKIGSEWITHETLDSVFEKDHKNRSLHYYRIVRNPNVATEAVSCALGKLTVKFSINEDDFPNRIAYVNRRGMLITDAGQRSRNPFHATLGSGWAKYAAVVCAADDKTDKAIREMEPPNHGTIEYERIIDLVKRDKMERDLNVARDEIARIIGDALRCSIKDQETNVSELAGIMPMDDEIGTDKNMQDAGRASDLTTRQMKQGKPGESTMLETDGEDTGEDIAASKKKSTKGGQSGSTQRSGKKQKPASPLLDRIRILQTNGKMRVAFTSLSHTKNIHFMVRPAGEMRMREDPIHVVRARVLGNNTSARIDDSGNIVTLSPVGDKRITVELSMGESKDAKQYTGYELVCMPEGEKS